MLLREWLVNIFVLQIIYMYCLDTFHEVISKISLIGVVPIFCDLHRDQSLPSFIFEYVQVRYQYEYRRLKQKMLAKETANVQSHFKLAKTAHRKEDSK